MRKALAKTVIAIILAAGCGGAVTMTTDNANACTKCNTSNINRKCGKCGSSKLWAIKNYTAANGKLRTDWECENCTHGFTTESRNGRDVLLKTEEPADTLLPHSK